MDKKNLIIGLLLLAAAAAVWFTQPKPPPPPPPSAARPNATTPASPANASSASPASAGATAATAPGDATFSSGLVTETADAQITTLENDFIIARFTNHGGAIVDVAFKKHPAVLGQPAPFVFNEQHIDPIFAFTSDAFTAGKLDRAATYKLVSATPTEIVFSAIVEDGANRVEVTRRYSIEPANSSTAPVAPAAPVTTAASGASAAPATSATTAALANSSAAPTATAASGTAVAPAAPAAAAPAAKPRDPYVIRHEVTFTNLTDHVTQLPALAFNIGTAALVSEHDTGQFLTAAHNDGEKTTFVSRSEFGGGGGFLGMNPTLPKLYIATPGNTVWAAVSDQFFSGILTPDAPATGIVTHRVELPPFPGTATPTVGLSVALNYAAPALAPNGSAKLGFDYYVGPKEYTRLSNFSQSQDDIMQYNSNWYYRITLADKLAPMMNNLMNYMHGFFGNWGLAIIGMTLLIKIITLPFTLVASRSARRMQKIQPELQALKEKYKDNQQKMTQATMELFKKHKVHPVASGCLPALITMPLFVAFFNMLRSAAELRFQGFLWARDLSAPDTIGHIFGLPINIFPLLAAGAMMLQMRLVPTPTADNSQAKMMKWGMPIFMLVFYYFWACALSLYSAVNGIFMVGQQLVINRMRDTGDPADPANVPANANAPVSKGARPMKNVTPAKRKK